MSSLQNSMGNAAMAEMVADNTMVGLDPALSRYYMSHNETLSSLDVQLSEGQMRDVRAFQENWEANRARYERVSARTGIPAGLVAALHWRESSGNFGTYLHQGDPLGKPAVNWPTNIPVFTDWEEAAVHALQQKSWLQDELGIKSDTTDVAAVATFAEGYNGYGYRYKDVNSPYVYSGTNAYTQGKYVADGRFSRTARDQQTGVLPLMGSIGPVGSQDLSPRLKTADDAWKMVEDGKIMLKSGSSGLEVEALQQRLSELGFNTSVDGQFGGGTVLSVKAFQVENGLQPDGIVGPSTAAAIDNAQSHQ